MTANVETLLATLSAEDIAALLAQVKVSQKNESAQRKEERERVKGVVQGITRIITKEGGPKATFKSGAQGWSLGGTVEVDGVTYKVSMLVRDAATIPTNDPTE